MFSFIISSISDSKVIYEIFYNIKNGAVDWWNNQYRILIDNF